MPRIAAAAIEFPPHYYEQEVLLEALREVWSRRHFNLDRLEQFHRSVLVGGRHLAVPLERYPELATFGASNDAWIQAALELATRVVGKLLDRAGLQAGDISLLTFTTVTGLAVPSLDARLMNRLPFKPSLKRNPIFGLGCLGGAAGVARVHDYLLGHPREAAILLAVELCSLTLQKEDLSVANIVSSGLFGDGAAAVLMVGDEHPLRGPRTLDSRSVFFPNSEDVMGWSISESGFGVVLSPDVPLYARDHLPPAIRGFLHEHGLSTGDIQHWIAHPGGPRVMQGLAEGLELPAEALQTSQAVLSEVGNLSSASVLYVLERTLARGREGERGLMLAMGPAFCAEAVLLQW